VGIPRYGRWSREFDRRKGIDRIEFIGPDGLLETRPTFAHQPAELRYDHHGYEKVVPKGEAVTAVRFTPWQEAGGEVEFVDGRLRLPPFRYGLMVKVRVT